MTPILNERSYAQLYGGSIVETDPGGRQATGQKAKTSSPRRAGRKTSPKSEDDGKKNGKRGRPRVDPQDRSAVERRRTQIRLAQRAYRERKETSISALEKQVSELQQTISEMNTTFLEYNDYALASGIIAKYPSFGEHLKMTTERFLDLTRNANLATEGEDESLGFSIKKPYEESRHNHHKASLPSRTTSLPSPASRAPKFAQQIEQTEPPNLWGYQFPTNEPQVVDVDDVRLDLLEQPAYNLDNNNVTQWVNDRMQQYRAEVPSPILSSQTPAKPFVMDPAADGLLKTTYTYSFQESSFGRRLLRSSYEKTYRMLTNPQVSEETINHFLRYTLCFGSKESIINKLSIMLKRSSKENIEHWNMPIQHIGGAGLHYDRTANSCQELPQNWKDELSIGPYKPRGTGVRVNTPGYPLSLIQYANLEGKWFDPFDVEAYLKEKGLNLDGFSFLAEMEVEDTSWPPSMGNSVTSPESGSLSTVTDPSSPDTSNSNDMANNQSAPVGDYFFNANDLDLPSNLDLAMTDATMNYDLDMFGNLPTLDETAKAAHGASIPFQNPGAVRKRKLLIDVEKLLTSLNEKAICLGRAPGFRQQDVDDALFEALQEAY